MTEKAQRRLAAIVSADVVGFSRLMQADEAGTHARLKARFREQVAPRIEAAGGRIVKPEFSFPGGRRFHFQDPDGYELAVWTAT